MAYLGVLFVLAFAATCQAFAPTVTFSCAAGPVYTVGVTDAVVGGVIFIDGACAQQVVTATTESFTFNAGACTSLPALATDFYIVLQEYATLNQLTDMRIKASCTTDLTSQTQNIAITAGGEATEDATQTDSITPTFTTVIESSGTALTSGTVGDSADIKISFDDTDEAATFGFKVTDVTYNGDSIVSGGCSAYSSFFPDPSLPTAGSLTIPITLVRPVTSSDTSVSATALTIVITLEVCDGTCVAATCGARKRRSAEESTPFSTTKTYATLLVYPPGQLPNGANSGYGSGDADIDDVCFSRAPMMAVMVCLGVALAICVAISCWMYFKLRYAAPKKSNSDSFSNSAYKA